MIGDLSFTAETLRTRIAGLESERDAWIEEYHESIRIGLLLRAENVRLRQALQRFLETTEGEDAVSGMALHGPITLARAALAIPAQSLAQETPAERFAADKVRDLFPG